MWAALLAPKVTGALPWLGGRRITDGSRSWRLLSSLPPEFGWYKFGFAGGRDATLEDEIPTEPNAVLLARLPAVRGYLVGDRLICDSARVHPDPLRLVEQTTPVFLVERGLGRFARAVVAVLDGRLVYSAQEFPLGPESAVEAAYQDRAESVAGISCVTPALDLAFRWISQQRERHEKRERALEAQRVEAARVAAAAVRREQALKDAGTGAERRALATRDFPTAAKIALAVSGAELLDTQSAPDPGQHVVTFRFRNRRFRSVVTSDLFVVDAGFCLDGDDYKLSLETIPGTISEALDRGVLHVYH